MSKKSYHDDYVQVYIHKQDAVSLFAELARMLGIDDLGARGAKPRIVHFALRFTTLVLAAFSDKELQSVLIERIQEGVLPEWALDGRSGKTKRKSTVYAKE